MLRRKRRVGAKSCCTGSAAGKTEPHRFDRLSRLDNAGWEILRKQITDKQLAIVSLDLPTSHLALTRVASDEFTRSMLKAVNGMMLDMLAAIARKDYEDRRRRLLEAASTAIAPLQDAIDLGIVSEQEKMLLSEWRSYHAQLMRMDISKPDWPVPPGEI